MALTRYDAECDFEKLKDIILGNSLKNNINFCAYDYIYPFTNDNIKSIFDYINVSGGLASVTGSGDHPLTGVLHGATKVTCFDINRFSQYFAELKRGAFLALERDDFMRFYKINPSLENYKTDPFVNISNHKIFLNDLSKPLFCKACQELDISIGHFFELLLPFISEPNSCNFVYTYFNPLLNEYIDEEKYYELKEKLKYAIIEYINSDIRDLNKHLGKNQYSAMVFSNILNHFSLKELKQFYKKALKKLSVNNLSQDGIIQLGIGFESWTKAFSIKGGYRLNPDFVKMHQDEFYEIEDKGQILTFYKK